MQAQQIAPTFFQALVDAVHEVASGTGRPVALTLSPVARSGRSVRDPGSLYPLTAERLPVSDVETPEKAVL